MADEKEFIGGMYPKKPLKDFIKCQISINRKQFIDWLKSATSEEHDTWINIDIKESKSGDKDDLDGHNQTFATKTTQTTSNAKHTTQRRTS